MQYLNERFRELLNDSPKFIPAKQKMIEEVRTFFQNFHDDPKLLSQWGHNYFCDIDGGRLIFDLNKPHEHVCEICGKRYTGEVYDGVWRYFYRNEAVLTMMKAAALYKATGDREYLGILKDLMMFYAERYLEFPLHDKAGRVYPDYSTMKWGCGRILPQGLNEAIITTRMIQALEIVKEDLEEEFLEKGYRLLFAEVWKLLKPQVDRLSNISCWKNAAIGMIGLFFGKEELIDFAVNGLFGLVYQIENGVTAEHFWYEGSIHYNFFTLEGLSALLLFTKIYDYQLPAHVEETIRNMGIAAYHYAFSNLFFPNPNDGWPNVNLKTYSYIYHVLAKCFGYDSEIGTILKIISSHPVPRTTLPLSKPYYVFEDISFEHMVLNTDFENGEAHLKQETQNYPRSNYGLIRNGHYDAFLKYGHNTESHAHPDVMSLEVVALGNYLSRDLSNAGYRSKMYREWHRTTAAHTTVAVDGSNQHSTHPGKTLHYDGVSISAVCENVYPGVDFERSVALSGKALSDRFLVRSETRHTYDYFFHFEAEVELELSGTFEPADLGFRDAGYAHLQNVRKLSGAEKEFNFRLKTGSRAFAGRIDLAGKELYVLDSYDNPVNKMRKTLVVRQIGKNAEFRLELRML